MIKAGDLRIGNLTYWGGKEYVVRLETFYTAIVEKGRNIFDDLSPIPLNEDWLLRMGFRKHEGSDWEFVKKGIGLLKQTKAELNPQHIYDFGFGWSTPTGKECSRTISYVHQLQNLYHALTGEELEIKSTA